MTSFEMQVPPPSGGGLADVTLDGVDVTSALEGVDLRFHGDMRRPLVVLTLSHTLTHQVRAGDVQVAVNLAPEVRRALVAAGWREPADSLAPAAAEESGPG